MLRLPQAFTYYPTARAFSPRLSLISGSDTRSILRCPRASCLIIVRHDDLPAFGPVGAMQPNSSASASSTGHSSARLRTKGRAKCSFVTFAFSAIMPPTLNYSTTIHLRQALPFQPFMTVPFIPFTPAKRSKQLLPGGGGVQKLHQPAHALTLILD